MTQALKVHIRRGFLTKEEAERIEKEAKLKTTREIMKEIQEDRNKTMDDKRGSPYWCELCEGMNYDHDCDCDSCHGRE